MPEEARVLGGPERLERVAKLLAQKRPDNPKRSMGYLIRTYERMRSRGE